MLPGPGGGAFLALSAITASGALNPTASFVFVTELLASFVLSIELPGIVPAIRALSAIAC
jgi:hypothetical protein